MSNPWLAVPLEEYEGHMSSANVRQLTVLAELFKRALALCSPGSVAVLGVAGGNGLERIDSTVTRRVAGVDINPKYLDAVRQRFATLPGLELHACDVAQSSLSLAPVALVHAALVFEHAGLGLALANALSWVAPEGRLSVVLQLPGATEQDVACTGYASIQTLKQVFALIDIDGFQRLLQGHGFKLIEEERRSVPGGKALWLGIFARSA